MQFAAKETRSVPEIAQILCVAAAQDGQVLQYVPDALQRSRPGMVRAAVAHTGLSLRFCASEYREDVATVLAAVAQNGLAFQFAARELRADRAVVLTAVALSGLALKHAAREHLLDAEVVITAVAADGQ